MAATASSVRSLPAPPRLHWAIVLVLCALTRNIFGVIWLVYQAVWVRRVLGWNRALWWLLAYVLLVAGTLLVLFQSPFREPASNVHWALAGLCAMLLTYLIGVFQLRRELEEPEIDLLLSGGMTFFFAPVYFQYFLRDWQAPGATRV